MLLLLSVLILVHEAGHFIAAKIFGMKVEKFGFGLPIGPTLYEKKIGDTTVLIHAFLLGGYIAFPDDEKSCELELDSKERFLNKPIYQRAIVVSAGVFANVICAFVLVLLTAFLWGHIPAGKYDIYINNIVADKNAPVWASGMQKGDKVVELNNTPITNTASLVNIIKLSKAYDGIYSEALANELYGKLKEKNPAFTENEIISKDAVVQLPAKILTESAISLNTAVEKGIKPYKNNEKKLPAKLIKLRDELKGKSYYISNEQYSLRDLSIALADNVHPLFFKVERNGKITELLPITPGVNGTIGIKLEAKEVLITTKSFVSAIKASYTYLSENTYYMLYGLGQIFTGEVPLKDLHGIVAITKVGGDIINNSGIFYGLLLTAIISMDLAIINFLPIPALDGGHIMFLIIEKIRGKKVDEKIVEKISSVFFGLLVLLMIFVIFNDIFGLMTNKF